MAVVLSWGENQLSAIKAGPAIDKGPTHPFRIEERWHDLQHVVTNLISII